MTIITIKSKLLFLYSGVDEQMNREIEMSGSCNLISRGRKLGLLDALFMVNSLIDSFDS